jgi:hypothetical protein
MKKWIILFTLSLALVLFDYLYHEEFGLHEAFLVMVIFFFVQTFVLFRLDGITKEEWKVQMAMVKITLRLLSALVFILVVMLSYTDRFQLVVQFFSLYLAFMTFEIIMALANLRRN